MRKSADIATDRLCPPMHEVDRRLSKPLIRELEQTAQDPVYADINYIASRAANGLLAYLQEIQSRRRCRHA